MQKPAIIKAIHSATFDVFSTMLGLEIQSSPEHTGEGASSVTDGVMAFVGIAGPWVGSGVICCGAKFACRLCASLLMTEAETVNEEVLDAVGEIANMIIGGFKNTAEEAVGPLAMSVPTVIFGKNFTSRTLGKNDWIILPFKCDEDPFEVRVWFAPAPVPTDRSAMRVPVPVTIDV